MPSGPLYAQQDAAECMKLFVGKTTARAFRSLSGDAVLVVWKPAILGAAMLYFEIEEGRQIKFGFSGDRWSLIAFITGIRRRRPILFAKVRADRPGDDIETAKFG